MEFHKIEELEGMPFSKPTLKLISVLNEFIERRLEIQAKFDQYDKGLADNKQNQLFAAYI